MELIMSWRLHLTNQAISQLNIIDSTPPLLATWLDRQRVLFYELQTGTSAGEGTHTPPETNERQSDTWQVFTTNLTAPDGTYLPILQTQKLTTYATDDGRMRLYHTGHADLYLHTDGKEFTLEKI